LRQPALAPQLKRDPLGGGVTHPLAMTPEHHARITWSTEHVRRGLLAVNETIDPAWLEGARPTDDGWSLICIFDTPPREQGSPSSARVRWLMENAPHEWLKPGASLRLFERATMDAAKVEILD